jgi:hypothetical protein
MWPAYTWKLEIPVFGDSYVLWWKNTMGMTQIKKKNKIMSRENRVGFTLGINDWSWVLPCTV